METMKKYKWLILALAIIAILVIAWFIYKSIPAEEGGGAPPVNTTVTQPGLAELAAGFFGGAWLGGIKDLFGGKPKVDCQNGCDKNKPGYDCVGFPTTDCGFGRVQG